LAAHFENVVEGNDMNYERTQENAEYVIEFHLLEKRILALNVRVRR
jgi:hypothetical protein